MKTKNIFLFVLALIGGGLLQAQHENDNWRFGSNNWRFDTNVAPNGFIQTTGLNPYIRYASSVISDKNTGNLLFYSNGYNVYNKNNGIMDGGDHLFGAISYEYTSIGNPSDQSSVIVPLPGSNSKYYVFYINGDRNLKDQTTVPTPNPATNYGLRYAIVDMSLNGGLGKVISKNNILFSNSLTNALTSTFGSDGNSYWIVTANNGNILSYKLDASGLNTTPVVSIGKEYGTFIKISPDSKKLLTRKYNAMWLSDFNNTTGSVTNSVNIVANNNFIGSYNDASGTPNSAEFSPDSNIVYFIGAQACLCLYPAGIIGWSGLSMYNITTGSLVGAANTSSQYIFPLNGTTASMQRATNGKIYLIYNTKQQDDGFGFYKVSFGSDSTFPPTSYSWGVINTPNVWSPTVNPLSTITPPAGTSNGFSFPQLIPSSSDAVNPCPDVLTITTPVTSSQIYQAGKSIFASSAINDNLTVDYKAGLNVDLLPGFSVNAVTNGVFKAYISPCTISAFLKERTVGAMEPNFAKTNLNTTFSDVKIYPNPASTIVKIDSGRNKVAGWMLYDLSGKVVLDGKDTTIPVEKLPKSSYLLVIKLDNGTSTSKKIIVQ
ncbi:hypothetical protein C1637_20625 [Chryseobacterium lactis]|uniref:T9SS C-terminal target domain-containing protein n=1 Tax=Chryseobacterium lactis TaxID=1241981 RepID=A0A3G6RME9_CHRLC|nr:3-coathanger stack domain-containing protein [Chryseobacterium lactis]AZA82654.1 T9SS C-terminal target domain-containing protein [Chryseobacterium lactis]AZB03036.1 T9SS C-terminal target domain-containing protein [Chryseobacterium lactis]PNW11825.1 hypothetical protein C1637_20625 [Chryseobacterium lactis]